MHNMHTRSDVVSSCAYMWKMSKIFGSQTLHSCWCSVLLFKSPYRFFSSKLPITPICPLCLHAFSLAPSFCSKISHRIIN